MKSDDLDPDARRRPGDDACNGRHFGGGPPRPEAANRRLEQI